MEQEKEMSTYERFFHNKWRPAIGWIYAIVVAFDFMLAPVGYNVAQFIAGTELSQWKPITLEGGGLFHVSMLTIVGATAWGRTQEKLKQAQSDIGKIG